METSRPFQPGDLSDEWLAALDAFRVWLRTPDLEPIGTSFAVPAPFAPRARARICPTQRRIRRPR